MSDMGVKPAYTWFKSEMTVYLENKLYHAIAIYNFYRTLLLQECL
jgi:hypothetical protein